MSSRLAAELIAEGAAVSRDVYIPMRQGVLWTGIIKSKVQAKLIIVHQDLEIQEDTDFFVWDMGADVTLSNAFLEDHKLLPTIAGPNDDVKLLQFSTVQPGWASEQSMNTREVRGIMNHVQADVFEEVVQRPKSSAQAGSRSEKVPTTGDESESERANRPKGRTTGGCTLASHDSWTLQRALKLREELQQQLKSPDPVVKKRLDDLCEKYAEAFGTDVSKPCLLKRFSIKLKNGAQYVALLPRRVSQPVLEEMQKQIAQMLEMGVIEPSDSPWSAPVVMVRRPGSSKLRLAIDYRLLNQMTEPAPFAMPDMHDVLDKLVGKKYYWSVDVSSYYWQIEMTDESKPLTAFVIPGGGKFQFRRVPFGLRAAPMWAQSQLRESLDKNEDTRGLVNFIDDISYGSDDPDDLCSKFEALLKFAIANGIKLKKEKCCLGVPALKALGCVINSQGKWIDPDRVLSLLRIEPAGNLKQLKQLLGSLNFVRQWIAHAATTCAPLTDLLKKNAKFEWGPEQDEALEKLKKEVQCSECLANIDPKLPVYLRPDASNVGCAAVLFQMIEVLENDAKIQRPRAIAYASRRFSAAERKWSTAEGEAFAIKWSMQMFQPLIQCLPVIIESDHANHRFMYSSQTSAKIQRWRMYLEQFDYEIRHIPGKDQEVADGLSRLHLRNLTLTAPTNEQAALERRKGIIASNTYLAGVERDRHPTEDLQDLEEDEEVHDGDGEGGLEENFFEALSRSEYPITATSQHMQADQAPSQEQCDNAEQAQWTHMGDAPDEDPIESKPPPLRASRNWGEEVRCSRTYGIGYKLLNKMGWRAERELRLLEQETKENKYAGIGYGQEGRANHMKAMVNVLDASFDSIMEQAHNDRAGHVGKLRTYRRIRKLEGFPWNQKTQEIQDRVCSWVDSCMTCQKVWKIRGSHQGPSTAIIRQRPFTEVSMDLIRVATKDKDGHQHVLNILDSFSRFSELFALRTGDAESVAECLFSIYNRYGQPLRLRSDGAKAFHGAVITQLNKWLKIQDKSTLAYSPFQNGQNERRNQEIGRHLRAMVVSDVVGINSVMRWGVLLPAVQRILNNTWNSDTGCTPNELVLGGYGDSELAMIAHDPAFEEGLSVEPSSYARELEEAQFEILRRSEIHQENRLKKVLEDARQHPSRQLEEGSIVLAVRGGFGKRPKDKLQTRYTGPYIVVDRPDPSHSIVRISHIATKKIEDRHMNELVVCNMSRFRELEEAVPFALQDAWTYQVERILEHRPEGPRRANGRLRAKSKYEFLTKYKHIPLSQEEGEENPSWQPWAYLKHLSALREYCNQPQVKAALGDNFYVSESSDSDESN
jgi:hypothetical protein